MAIDDWMRGDGTDALQGDTNASLIDDYLTAYMQDPLDLLLRKHRRGCVCRFASITSVVVGVGEVTCANNPGDARRFRSNPTSELTLDASDLDVGLTFTASTWYYIYAVADAEDTEFTGVISVNETFPTTGVSFARKIGYFYSDAAGQVSSVGNIREGDAPNSLQGLGETDITTLSTTFEDMDDMELRFYCAGDRPVKLTLACVLSVNSEAQVLISINVDGSDVIQAHTNDRVTSGNQVIATRTIKLDAGTHLIKGQWKLGASGPTASNLASSGAYRTLLVEEL